MRRKLVWIGCLSLFGSSALAQRADLALLAGISGPHGATTTAPGSATSSGNVSPGFQLNYARRFFHGPVDLAVELPLVIAIRVSGQTVTTSSGTATAGSSDPDVFFTPGLRARIMPASRLALYAVAGGGFASFGATPTIAPPSTVIPGNRQNSPVFDYGGGVDLRLTHLLSLRADARDFVSYVGLGEVAGRNHGIFAAGIALHF